MPYAHIFAPPGWEVIALSVFQAGIIFILVIGGLQIVGRRVFAERGPQDLVIIVLAAEACDLGLAHEDSGFWGSVASVVTILFMGYLAERIEFIRHLLNRKPVVLFENGTLHKTIMRKFMVDEDDLNEIARERGRASYKEFQAMMLEGDGKISAIEATSKKTSKAG